ncbi:MAG: prolipoprotein diacylglyceryl transferase [Ignavibacteriales bacterium]|nr:prolipoprotein diacylglyceryl transferase [Ignavibacteriales bacterium]
MYPILFEIGPFTVYSYGLMLALGFLIASWIMTKEYKRKSLDANLAGNITLIALVTGVIGAKVLYLLEHWNHFVADPSGMAFSPGGLSFFGGFLLATTSIYIYTRSKKINFLTVADGTAPGLMMGYGVARLGCHFAGDGDYGFPTDLPWGTDYSRGTYPPSEALRNFPEITGRFPNGVVPDTILCHPTPVYEFLICALFFFVLWKYRTRIATTGKLFMLYLTLAGLERFSIEFLRINPRVLFGLSEYQFIAAGLVLVGAIGWRLLSGRGRASSPS